MRNFPHISLRKTGENITRLMEEAGLSVKEVQEAFGFGNPQAIYKWKRGETLPSIDNLVALAVLLHTTVDRIVVIEQ